MPIGRVTPLSFCCSPCVLGMRVSAMTTNITVTTMPMATYGSLITARSCSLILAFSISLSVPKIICPASSRLSESRLGSTIIDAMAIPDNEPTGLKACARFSRRVDVLLSPNDSIYGLAVVSRNASPKVKMYSDTQKNVKLWHSAAGMKRNAPAAYSPRPSSIPPL